MNRRATRLIVLMCISALPLIALAQSGSGGSSGKPIVRFLIGSRGAFNQLGFIQAYARALPNIEIVTVETTRPGRLEELQTGEADLVINASQAAFLAYSGQLRTTTERFDRLRAIAALGVAPLHLVAAPDSGIKSVVDLRGRAVSFGILDGEAHRSAVAVLDAFGIGPDALTNTSMQAEQAAVAMRAGRIQAMFVVSGYPAEAVREATAFGAYLVPIDGPPAARLRARSGFLHPSFIPAGAYAGQTVPIRTLGTQQMLVTRRDLDEQIVYELTKHFFGSLPKISALVNSLRHMDVNQASATSIPLHDGAARYYRERELLR